MKAVLAQLENKGTAKGREGMARYGIVAKKAYGVSVRDCQLIAKPFRHDHALAQALFKTGWFEARLVAAFVDDPAVISAAEMQRWARAFENWADCDTAVMHLFDQSPHAWPLTRKWCTAKPEFEKRAGFAMLASMALHHKDEPSAPFIKSLALVEKASRDERNFVKKAVNWALRSIGSRDTACHAAAMKRSAKLAASDDATARWIGKDALKQLDTAATRKRVARGDARA